MTKLIWLIGRMMGEPESTLSADELAWRATWGRRAKLTAWVIAATFALWVIGSYADVAIAEPREAIARMLWVGDASYDDVRPGAGMRASSLRIVLQDGARLLFDGESEPVVYYTTRGALRDFVAGERVRVTYRNGTRLFGNGMTITKLSKLESPSGAQGL